MPAPTGRLSTALLSFVSVLLCATPLCLGACPHGGARRLAQDDAVPTQEPTTANPAAVPESPAPPVGAVEEPATSTLLTETADCPEECVGEQITCHHGRCRDASAPTEASTSAESVSCKVAMDCEAMQGVQQDCHHGICTVVQSAGEQAAAAPGAAVEPSPLGAPAAPPSASVPVAVGCSTAGNVGSGCAVDACCCPDLQCLDDPMASNGGQKTCQEPKGDPPCYKVQKGGRCGVDDCCCGKLECIGAPGNPTSKSCQDPIICPKPPKCSGPGRVCSTSGDLDCCDGMTCNIQMGDKGVCAPDGKAACSNQGESCKDKACCGLGKNSLWCGENLICEYTGAPPPPIPGVCALEGSWCSSTPANDPKDTHCCHFGPGYITCSERNLCERADGGSGTDGGGTSGTSVGSPSKECRVDPIEKPVVPPGKGGMEDKGGVTPPGGSGNGCSNQGESCDEKACCGEGKNSLWCGEDLKCEYTGFPPPPIPGVCQAEGLECDIDPTNDPKNKHCCRFGPGHVTCSSNNKCERTDGKTSGNTGSTTSSTSTTSGGTSGRTVEASKSGCVSTGGLGIMSAAGLLAAFAV